MTINIKQAPAKAYIEINQSYSLRYTYLKHVGENNYVEFFYPVKCKDFLNDILYAEETQKPVYIYGLSYDPRVDKIDRDKTRLALHFPSLEAKKKTIENLSFLHKLEKENGLEPTVITECYEHHLIAMVEGDPYWQKATYLISFYTSFLRWLGYPLIEGQLVSQTIRNIMCTDNSHMMTYKCFDRMAFFEQNVRCLDNILNDPEMGVFSTRGPIIEIHTVHNSGGILGTIMETKTPYSEYSHAFQNIYRERSQKCAA